MVYQNDTLEIKDFILSPFDNNIIWTFNVNDYSYELNLKDNSWKQLDYRLGKYAFKLRKEEITRDEMNPDLLWLSPESHELAVYKNSNSQLIPFPNITDVTTLFFIKQDVIVGTTSGLYKIKRSDFSTTKIKQLAELPVKSIIDRKNNFLQINDSYLYNYQQDVVTGSYKTPSIIEFKAVGDLMICLSKTGKLLILKNNDTINSIAFKSKDLNNITNDNDYIWFPDDLKSGIIRYSIPNNIFEMVRIGYDYRDYKVSAHDSLIWFLNREGFLVFNKNNLNTYRVFKEDSSAYTGLYADSAYVIANTDNKINILRKDHLLNYSTDIKQLVIEETPFFSEVSDLLSSFKGNFVASYNKYRQIYLKYETNRNIRVQRKLVELKESLPALLLNSYATSKEFEKYIVDTIKDGFLSASYYQHMVKQAIYEGRLNDALHYDSLISNGFADYRTELYHSQIAAVERANELISLINKSGVTEDEKLWNTGTAFYKLFVIAGPHGKHGINMTLPFTFLKQLKNRYPKSQFSDNAELMMLRHIEAEIYASGDENLMQKVIGEYYALLSKYPSSELRPDMLHRLVWLYLNIKADVPDKRKNIEKAKVCLDSILIEYPRYPLEHDLTDITQQLTDALNNSSWELNLILGKRTFNINEPIIVTYEFKNIDSKPKMLSISESRKIPNFIISVERAIQHNDYNLTPIELEPDFTEFNKNRIDTLVPQNGKYTEKWNILETARNSVKLPPGRFVLSEEGRYKITAKPFDNSFDGYVQSNTIWITIKNPNRD